jgi:aryl-alcohol dehydrogenase-like predicted oxidoreductase
MRYVKLGSTGLEVSPVCMGCMSFGTPELGNSSWSMPEDDAQPFFRRAVELGINFFDTANVYSEGTSEEITGRALAKFAQRDEIVIATKLNGRMHEGPNGMGLSRKAIMSEIDHSLRRLNVDYIDLWQIHRLDHETPVAEIMESLHDVVKSGKVRYLGASSMFAWEFSKLQYTASANGWTRFVSMQNFYNLIYREEEREMLPLCADLGVGVIPWSPLATGLLTRDWSESTARSEASAAATGRPDGDRVIVERVAEIAAARGLSRAQIALAWVLKNPVVTAPIVGATKIKHLDDAIGAIDVTLSADEIARLEAPYTTRPVDGISWSRPRPS